MASFAHTCLNANHVSAPCPMRTEHGEDYGKDASTSWPRHRPRRNASARRDQQKRSYTRCVLRLLSGLNSIESHRGNTLSQTGTVLRDLLQMQTDTYAIPVSNDGVRYHTPHNVEKNVNICKHWLNNRCTYGDACRFHHGYVRNDDDSSHNDEHNDFSYDSGSLYGCEDSYGNNPYSDAADFDNDDGIIEACRKSCKLTELLLLEFGNQVDAYIADRTADNPEAGHEATANRYDGENDYVDPLCVAEGSAGTGSIEPAVAEDINEIVNILCCLTAEDLQEALVSLPPHLLSEVQERLSDLTGRNQYSVHGQHSTSSKELESLEETSRILDDNIGRDASSLLYHGNMNKKLIRKSLGNEALQAALRCSVNAKPNRQGVYEYMSNNSATMNSSRCVNRSSCAAASNGGAEATFLARPREVDKHSLAEHCPPKGQRMKKKKPQRTTRSCFLSHDDS